MTEYLSDCCNRVAVLLEYLKKSCYLYRCLISNGLLPLLHWIAMDLIEQSLDGIFYILRLLIYLRVYREDLHCCI